MLFRLLSVIRTHTMPPALLVGVDPHREFDSVDSLQLPAGHLLGEALAEAHAEERIYEGVALAKRGFRGSNAQA